MGTDVSLHSTLPSGAHRFDRHVSQGGRTVIPLGSIPAPSFGDLLRQQRRARDLTQEDLAAHAGVSVRAISDLERGARAHPYRETAKALANALGLTGETRIAFLSAAQGLARGPRRHDALRRRKSLPRPLTALVGRQDEQELLRCWIEDDRLPLITLTGPAGVGKTRLAIEVATVLLAAFADGVAFVDLAMVDESAYVASAIASALGVPEIGSTPPLELLRGVLQHRQMLLVLDNFEHLLVAAPLVSEFVQAAPSLQVLTTSRAPLRLLGERVFSLSPLLTPPDDDFETLCGGDDWPAVKLFIDRTRDANAGFALRSGDVSVIAELCRRLDGLPLAIELAAASVKHLAAPTLLDRIEHRFDVLTAGRRDAPSRQRTLEAAIAWSHDLLEPEEQTLFRALSVFSGGWTVESAESVGVACEVSQPVAALGALVEQSLVTQSDHDVAPRYRMLESIREFASMQLRVAGEERRARQAQLTYLRLLAQACDLNLLDSEVGVRLSRLRAEDANLRTGIGWALEHDPEQAVLLLADLDFYWFLSDQTRVGIDLLARVLATDIDTLPSARTRSLVQAAWLYSAVGNFVAAAPLAWEAQARAEHLDEPSAVAWSQLVLAGVALSHGETHDARVRFTSALAWFEADADPWGMVVCLTELGIAALEWGEPARALDVFGRVRAIVEERRLPNRYHAHYLVNLAQTYGQLGRIDEAIEASRQALALASEQGQYTTAAARVMLGCLQAERGEVGQAAELLSQGLHVTWVMQDHWALVRTMEAAATVMAAGLRPEVAARCLGAAAVMRDALPYPVGKGHRPILSRLKTSIRAQIGDQAFRHQWLAGCGQDLAAVVAEVESTLRLLVDTGASIPRPGTEVTSQKPIADS